jgi:hypothetical protein
VRAGGLKLPVGDHFSDDVCGVWMCLCVGRCPRAMLPPAMAHRTHQTTGSIACLPTL